MSERVFGAIIIAGLAIGFCKLVWAGLNWLTAWRSRRAAVRRRLGLAEIEEAAKMPCGNELDDGLTIPDLPRGRSIPNVICNSRST